MHCTEATSYPCWHRFAKVPPMLMTSSSGCGDITRMRMPFTPSSMTKPYWYKTRQDKTQITRWRDLTFNLLQITGKNIALHLCCCS